MHWHSTAEHLVDGAMGNKEGSPQHAQHALVAPPPPPPLPHHRPTNPSPTNRPSAQPCLGLTNHALAGEVTALELHIVTAVDNTTDVPVPQACNEKLCLAVFGIRQNVSAEEGWQEGLQGISGRQGHSCSLRSAASPCVHVLGRETPPSPLTSRGHAPPLPFHVRCR